MRGYRTRDSGQAFRGRDRVTSAGRARTTAWRTACTQWIAVVDLLQNGVQGFAVDRAARSCGFIRRSARSERPAIFPPLRLPVADRVERVYGTLVESRYAP